MNPIQSLELRALRAKHNLNQHQFWTRVGITQSGGSRYESGQLMPACVALLVTLVYVHGIDPMTPCHTLTWSHTKPTAPGYYWLRMRNCAPFTEQPPRLISAQLELDGELWIYEGPNYDEPYIFVEDMSDEFEYAGPITPPSEPQDIPAFLKVVAP